MNRIICKDALAALRELPDRYVNLCVTSPPYYGLRDYGVDGQIGTEESPQAYICRLVEVFREVRRVLTDDGTLWLNIADSYAGREYGKGHRRKRTAKIITVPIRRRRFTECRLCGTESRQRI